MLPLYLEKLTSAELHDRAEKLLDLQEECRICPRECLAKRHFGEKGDCNSTDELIVSSIGPHFGEEAPLVGTNGSGTIFLTNCNLKCEFCQNYDISQLGSGHMISIEKLASSMLALQNRGCHNVNFVTPTHYVPQIVSALILAVESGFELPIVYNCGGYESVETIKMLDGIIDIYMPDLKYSNNSNALKYSHVLNYWEIATAALKEMHNQVGDLKIGKRGIAQRGMLIRHLILPNNIAGSKSVLEFIANELSKNSYVNIMDQYHPDYKAARYPELNRTFAPDEYNRTALYAKNLGLTRGFDNER